MGDVSRMSVAVLGSFQVLRSGRPMTVPAGRVRTLLAVFTLEGTRSVARDTLVRELWGEAPPPSAAANLRNYLTELRGWATAAGGDLVRLGPGWQLQVHPEVDAIRFRTAIEAGRAALGRGDTMTGAHHLGAAVHMVKGTPLQDVAQGPMLLGHAQSLMVQWMSAVEDFAELLIEAGCFDEARCLLQDFVHRQPYRERAWSQLMLACSFSGDISAAVNAFARARDQLRDGLGAEPGAALTTLHHAILRGDAAVRLRPRAALAG